ncbi:MAG: heme exporter protein CcmD [Candidatus Accumulibacter sp.]|jgi:heme exporter protein D|uniref:heme exporter protein CcmD n=1 Tax=Accumulibacter sp. TaxID=2053492 RepID=UPI001A6130A0|nr:heme exporter protein CcmD [Accumulibacter sp.]MBL8395274.1 heme exporter protein CcmD [Accumulibacter sp.]
MHWNSLADFLAMGQHGPYVWGSVVVMALLMLAEPILLLQGRKRLIARLRRQYRAERSEARADRQTTSRRSKD